MTLQWYENLYVSEDAAHHIRRTIRRINHKKVTPGIYLLTLPGNENNVMDLVPSATLLQDAARRCCPQIIGLAKGKEDACGLMQRILMETYEHRGDFSIKDYLKDR